MEAILPPAALSLTGGSDAPASGARLREAVLAHLERRIAERLEPPPDWTRSSGTRCNCQNCRTLARFLDSPTESVWQLMAVQQVRDDVEQSIGQNHLDLDCAPDRQGRPYTPICTKNQASYEQRARQHEEDLASRQRLVVT
jgi:hypothetical protein